MTARMERRWRTPIKPRPTPAAPAPVGPRAGDIGDNPREYEFEPLTRPEPARTPAPSPTPNPAPAPTPGPAVPEPEKVPA